MAAVFEEQGDEGQPGTFHVVHRWCYLGAAASMEAARALAAGYGEPVFEPSTFRILQGHLARGLRLTPLPGEAGAPPCQPAGLTANPPPEPVIG
jgi:DNA polymerase-3 subunit epsilon